MKLYSHNFEFRNATAQFRDVFNNMVIKRTSVTNGTTNIQTIEVPCEYASRGRILKSLENKAGVFKMPMTAIEITGMDRDNSRVHSVNSGQEFQSTTGIDMWHNTAVPINIQYELSIVTKYQTDFNQIVTNFSAIMNPDIYITWPNPKGQGNLKTQIIWDGNINMEGVSEIDETTPWRIIGSTSFTVKTWIFPGSTLDGYTDTGPRIKSINFGGSYGELSGNIDLADWGASSGCVTLDENRLSRWYDVTEYGVTISSFWDKVRDGLIEYPNYDETPIIDVLSGTYWLNNLYGVLSGDLYDFSVSADLVTLIANSSNSDLFVTMETDDGRYDTLPSFLTPDTMTISGDWDAIWRRMLSGDLQLCSSTSSSPQTYQYLLSPESYIYLLYEDSTVIAL